jgi:hypothetical protein
MANNLGVGGNNLLLGRKGEVLLELEITDSARESKVAWMSDMTRESIQRKTYR